MTIAVSFPGKIGDLLYSLCTVRKISENYTEFIDFYTSEYCRPLEKLIRYQPYIRDFIVPANYKIDNMMCGVQPWNMNIQGEYSQIFQLGYKKFPNKSLHQFIAEEAGIRDIPGILYYHPVYETLNEPYIVIAPHLDVRYKDLFRSFYERSPYKTVVVGTKNEYPDFGIDKTGLDFIDTLAWLINAKGFIGMSANYVLAEGFSYPKILPHDGHSYDTRHLLYDETHFYPIDPSVDQLLEILKL
jgi:hypothetical protein